MKPTETVAGSLTFALGKLGGLAASRFAGRLESYGIKPRHCAVLELAGSAALSQQDIAARIGVTPSVVVDMVDELEALGALRRTQDPVDRRRRVVQLTAAGRTLRRKAVRCAQQVDAELLDALPEEARARVRSSLADLAAANDLSFD